MHAFDIIIENRKFVEKHDEQYEKWVHLTYDYIYHLERTGQIVKNKHQIIVKNNIIRVPVICPEKDALVLKNCSIYNKKVIREIEENANTKIVFNYTGRDADNPNYKIPTRSSFYILRSGWEFPLLCGDEQKTIPLYKIPKTDHGGVDYDNVFFWNQNYERIYGLWLSSGKYEAFAEEELTNPFSAINKTGRELAVLIEKLTGVPTYYFLFNYRGGTEEEDQQRKCPITGNDWYIEGKTSADFIAFKCDESRLVSELSTNSVEVI